MLRPPRAVVLPLVFAGLAGLAGLAACGDEPTPPPTGPATVRVDRYAYELDLATRASASKLTLHVVEGGNCVTLANRNPTVTAGAVTLDGAPAEVTLTDTTITACGAGWHAGTDLELAATMSQPLATLGPSDVGYSITPDTAGNFHYLVSWVEGCDRFGPCDPTPGTFARYTFTVRHPEGVRALCSGRVTATPTATTCEFDHDGGPTYSTFGLIAFEGWQETALGTWNGVRATLYAKEGARITTRLDRDYAAGFLTWMAARFGPYPYGDELRLIVAPTYWAGFEHPGNIVLSASLTPAQDTTNYDLHHTLIHELAHQWAGDQTTLADRLDFVWKEAMAEYLSFVYESETRPAYAALTLGSWKANAPRAAYHPVPEERPELFDFYGHVYAPGPMVLFRQLEAMTSREQVLDALAMVLGQQRALSVADVQAALEATTGLDLDTYFDIWVRGTGAPTWASFMVQVTREPPAQHVQLTETTDGALHPCDFDVELRGAGGESARVRFERGLEPDSFMNVDTDVPWVITSTVLDPDHECLAYPAAAAHRELAPPGWSPWVRRE